MAHRGGKRREGSPAMVTLDDDRFGKSGPRTGNKKSSFVETVAALVVGLLVVAALYVERNWLYDEAAWIKSAVEPPPVPAYDSLNLPPPPPPPPPPPNSPLLPAAPPLLRGAGGKNNPPTAGIPVPAAAAGNNNPAAAAAAAAPLPPAAPAQPVIHRGQPQPPAAPAAPAASAAVAAAAAPIIPQDLLAAVGAQIDKTVASVSALEASVKDLTSRVRQLKSQRKYASLGDPEALQATTRLQDACRKLLPLKYGPEPRRLELKVGGESCRWCCNRRTNERTNERIE